MEMKKSEDKGLSDIVVSIVVATYRRQEELQRALESIHNQTYRQFEIIVVDDNDNAEWNSKVEEIVNEFQEKTGLPINLVANHPKLGAAEARNVGISLANGSYVTFLDDDDLYLPARIEKQLNCMKAEDATYSVTDFGLYYEDDSLCELRIRTYLQGCHEKDLLLYHFKHHITCVNSMMFQTEYLKKIGGFSPIDVGDDFYLMMKAIKGGGKFCYAPYNEIKAYVHKGENGGLSSGQEKIKGENALFEYKKEFFHLLRRKDIRYIKMRHHAVLAFAYLRMRSFFLFLRECTFSFFSAPISCIQLFVSRKRMRSYE